MKAETERGWTSTSAPLTPDSVHALTLPPPLHLLPMSHPLTSSSPPHHWRCHSPSLTLPSPLVQASQTQTSRTLSWSPSPLRPRAAQVHHRLHEPVCAASSDACPALKADMLPFAVSVHTLLPVRRPCAHANRPQHSAPPRTHLACPTVHVLCTSHVACVQAQVRPVSCAHLLRARSSSGRRSPPPTSPPSSMPYLESATLDPQQAGVEGDEWESSPPQPIVRLKLASSHSDADSDYDSLRRLPEPRYGSSPVATSPARQLRDDTGVLRSRPAAPV